MLLLLLPLDWLEPCRQLPTLQLAPLLGLLQLLSCWLPFHPSLLLLLLLLPPLAARGARRVLSPQQRLLLRSVPPPLRHKRLHRVRTAKHRVLHAVRDSSLLLLLLQLVHRRGIAGAESLSWCRLAVCSFSLLLP